jgi:hypothetical protein
MSTNTDAIITTTDLVAAQAQLVNDGVPTMMESLQQTEPVLFGYILTAAHCVAGRLALGETRTDLVRQTADELLELALTVVLSLRAGHAPLWDRQDDSPSVAESDFDPENPPF